MKKRLEDACVLVTLGFCTGYALAFGYWIAACVFGAFLLLSTLLVILEWRARRKLEALNDELDRLQGKGPQP